jgi:hypothetical protein
VASRSRSSKSRAPSRRRQCHIPAVVVCTGFRLSDRLDVRGGLQAVPSGRNCWTDTDSGSRNRASGGSARLLFRSTLPTAVSASGFVAG